MENPQENLFALICKSLINECDLWYGADQTYNHKEWGIQIWVANGWTFIQVDSPGKINFSIRQKFILDTLIEKSKAKRKCKSFFGDYECHVATNIKDSKGNFVYVDKCLKEAVENLNAVGLKTVASCCGHGIINPKITIEGLSDGMESPTSDSGLHEDSVSNNEHSEVTVCECRPEWMLDVRANLVKCSKCGEIY